MKRFLPIFSVVALLMFATIGLIIRPTFYAHAASASKSRATGVAPMSKPHVARTPTRMCAVVTGMMSCDAMVMMPANGTMPGATPAAATAPAATTAPMGLTPANLQQAYNLPSAMGGNGQTVAIVDAFDDPNAEADLGVYRQQFGLPACTTANGCFKKVNENGAATPLPTANASWAGEISLDLDMVSAVCPNCHIDLVEANAATGQDLGTSVNTAANMGANEISNSYGGAESAANNTATAADYNHQGIIITASAGDMGFGVNMPAAFNTVVAVGGTTLTQAAGTARGWAETTWVGTGSGCSTVVAKPTFQNDPNCPNNRVVGDVAFEADPNTGVAVYDSFQTQNMGGPWLQFGGTSVGAPAIAATYALAGNANTVNAASSLYANAGMLNDVTTGNNGGNCGNNLCMAAVGYDGPTGNGTPNGVGAF